MEHNQGQKVSPYQKLVVALQDDLQKTEFILQAMGQSQINLIERVTSHILMAGGKRLRPVLLLAVSAACGGLGGKAAINLAASVEAIHTATLLHDDVVDDAGQRRGVSTANYVWGNQTPVLVGDFLFAEAFRLMVETGSLPALRILSQAAGIIAEGELLQLSHRGSIPDKQIYHQIIAAKTASLFAAACQSGAVSADMNEGITEKWWQFGHNFGICFQIIDDMLDYCGDEAVTGKAVGGDFLEGKVTLPFIEAASQDKQFWQDCLSATPEARLKLLPQALQRLEQGNIGDIVLNQARFYQNAALAALESTGINNAFTQGLCDMAQAALHRLS